MMIASLLFSILVSAAPSADTNELLARAEYALAAGELTTAAAALDAALAIDPDNVDALFAAGVLARQSQPANAVTLLSHLVQLDPSADEARLHLAMAFLEQGDADAASQAVTHVLQRHPSLPEALAVQNTIAAGLEHQSRWRLHSRLDVAAGYDSNLNLASNVLPSASRQAVGMALVDIALGGHYETTVRPFSLIARVTSLQPLSDRTQAGDNAASVIGLGAIGRHYIENVEAVLDLRYDEIYTDSFNTHHGRIITPSVYGALPLADRHRLRLLLGSEIHRVQNSPTTITGSTDIEPDSVVARGSVRDTIALGRWSLVVDGYARRAFSDGDNAATVASREVNFFEVGGQTAAELKITNALCGSANADIARRGFQASERTAELTLQAQLALRLTFRFIELHAEYAYAYNHSATETLRWQRHMVFAGVRTYTP